MYCWAVERADRGGMGGLEVSVPVESRFGLGVGLEGAGLEEMGEEEGWEVLRAEEMEEFARA